MARQFARVKVSIWSDDRWRTLTPPAQHLYFLLLTSPSLSHCGVADWRPTRLAAMAAGWTVDDVHAAADELIDALYLVVDEGTEEALIRSFLRHDGLMDQPKMAVAMASAHGAIASKVLRGVVVHELNRLRGDQPDLKGWGPVKAAEVLSKGSVDPSTYPLGKGSGKGIGKGNPKGSGKGSPTPYSYSYSNSLQPSSSQNSPTDDTGTLVLASVAPTGAGGGFDEFWAVYPRREGKGNARAAFAKAAAKAGAKAVIDGARRFAGDPNLPDDRTKIAHPATWLNQERWEDDPLPARHVQGRPTTQHQVSGALALAQQFRDSEPQQIEGPR